MAKLNFVKIMLTNLPSLQNWQNAISNLPVFGEGTKKPPPLSGRGNSKQTKHKLFDISHAFINRILLLSEAPT